MQHQIGEGRVRIYIPGMCEPSSRRLKANFLEELCTLNTGWAEAGVVRTNLLYKPVRNNEVNRCYTNAQRLLGWQLDRIDDEDVIRATVLEVLEENVQEFLQESWYRIPNAAKGRYGPRRQQTIGQRVRSQCRHGTYSYE